MEKHRAIPEGYMRIGEVAKKVGVTVRTLQYYDKEGLFSPSAISEGGYRLYGEKDAVRLLQVLMMKQLGFGLAEIKKRLTSLDTTGDVAKVLAEHATQIRNKVERLTETLGEIEALREEVLQMDVVDFRKIFSILALLQMKSPMHQVVKHFDNEFLDMVAAKMGSEEAFAMSETMNSLFREATKLRKEGVAPESEKAGNFVKEFGEKMWQAMGGDMELIQKMNEQGEKIMKMAEGGENFAATNKFLKSAFEAYHNSPAFRADEGEN